MSELADRYHAVRARIDAAARSCGRDPTTLRLIAVSKFHPVQAMRALYALGQREFGENYAQELADKAAQLRDLPALRLRYIGGIQRNKLKLLTGAHATIDTLASEAHAHALHERAQESGQRIEVLLQLNLLGEAQKGGIEPARLPALVECVRGLSALELAGLMTIPPADDLALSERAYTQLAELARQHGLRELSMGMSDDLEVAIRCGSTQLRIGTAIFGPRPKKA
jgi:pyridoxal phosphate enzyme (YggS family)